MLRFGVIRRMHRYLAWRYSRDIPAAGIAASPRQKAAESVGAALLGVIPAACIAAVLYAATGTPYAFLFLAAPPALFFTKGMGLRDIARKRAAGADAELFFFAIYCDIMEKTGRGLHGAFEALGGGGSMFPAMYRESLIIRREMRVFSRSFADVLHDLGAAHPSAAFRDFLRGYAVSQTTGGVGTSAYLHERLREYHTAARQRMDAYASTAEMLATIGSFGLAMFPIFVVVGGIMMDRYTLLFLCGFGILAVPAITAVLVARAAAASPVPAGRIPVRRAPVAAAGAAGAACFVLGMSSWWWEMVAVPLAVWCIANHCMSRGRLAGMSSLERSVPSFVRDINQKMRSNPSFFAAFTSAEAMAPYTRQFNDVLRGVRSRVLLGVEISRALQEVRTGSWLADCVMTLMAQAARSGSVTPAVLDRLALFASHHVETKREMSAKTATPLMTGYMGSVIVVMMIIMIPVMSFDQFAALDVLAGTVTDAAAPDAPYPGYDAGGLLAELNLVLVVVGAFCSMVLVSQIRYATILHSLHTGVLLAVIAGMLYYDRLAGVTLPA